MDIGQLLSLMVDAGASDMHLKVTSSPILRIDGALEVLEQLPQLSEDDAQAMLMQVTSPEQRFSFADKGELEFAYGVSGLGRFRVNALKQRGTTCMAFRMVPSTAPSIDELELPQILKELVMKPRGMILVTGHAGSGKSTTLAAMLDYLNENATRLVLSIEDPIEFLHSDKKCIIVQRDLGDDTSSFDNALTNALRHDPDVLVIGEMRDLNTITTAIRAAETGHLVLGTLHTIDSTQAIDRIIDVFPHGQQHQIRFQLSQVLEAILSQTLLPRIGGGRVAAVEVMIGTVAVRNTIRTERLHELPSLLQIGGQDGMQTLDQALSRLANQGMVTREAAMQRSSNPEHLLELLVRHREPFTPNIFPTTVTNIR